jgi:hypothetical protein
MLSNLYQADFFGFYGSYSFTPEVSSGKCFSNPAAIRLEVPL